MKGDCEILLIHSYLPAFLYQFAQFDSSVLCKQKSQVREASRSLN